MGLPIPIFRRHSEEKELGLKNLKLLFKVNPESDTYLAERSLEKITKSIIFHCFPDALCVSGSSAGSETDSGPMERVKKVSGGTPVVFCNTGCTKENIVEKLSSVMEPALEQRSKRMENQ